MKRAFTEAATLKMIVKTGAISFPPVSKGVDSITEVLVRRFAQSFENVFTFCLADPPKDKTGSFSCTWMVGMSEKESGAVRVGCGRYDWLFRTDEPFLARELTITIEFMQTLSSRSLGAIMDWLSGLPYPWCPVTTAVASAPEVEGLEVILDYVSRKK
jgi:hypothetical protein